MGNLRKFLVDAGSNKVLVKVRNKLLAMIRAKIWKMGNRNYKKLVNRTIEKILSLYITRVEVPETISAERRCFKVLTFFNADSENMKNISADQL